MEKCQFRRYCCNLSHTQVIFDGYSVEGYKIEEITAINNIKAWQFLLFK